MYLDDVLTAAVCLSLTAAERGGDSFGYRAPGSRPGDTAFGGPDTADEMLVCGPCVDFLLFSPAHAATFRAFLAFRSFLSE